MTEQRYARAVVSAEQLCEMACSPFRRDEAGPFGKVPFLLVDMSRPPGGLTGAQRDALHAWLARQSCPVVAIAQVVEDPMAAACDVVVRDMARAVPVLAGIERSPHAAMVLVQVLRVTSGMPVAHALVVESLAYATLQGGADFRRWLKSRTAAERVVSTNAGPAVEVERRGKQLFVRLNRPSRRNSLTVEMRDALAEALELVLADDSIESVRMSGRGRCFSVGGELEEFGEAPDPASAHAVRSVRLPAALLARCADRVECHLHGACIGAGIEIPAFARRVTAHPGTFFQLPEIRYGLIPGAGGCVSLPLRIGRQRTAYLALSARRIDARTALRWGLVDELVE